MSDAGSFTWYNWNAEGKKIFKMKAKGSFGGSTGGNAEFKCQKWNSKTGTREK